MQKAKNRHNIIVNTKVLVCKKICHTIEGYVGSKRISYAFERGYKKCSVCECYFLQAEGYIRCKCCNYKLRVKQPSRKMYVKNIVEKHKDEISTMTKIPRGRNSVFK